MPFLEERSAFERELDAHYAAYPSDVSRVEREMDEISARHPEWLPYRRKAMAYETIAARCRVKVFRHFPFYFEMDTGRPRGGWGPCGLGGWMQRQPFARHLATECAAWWKPCREKGLAEGATVLDDIHHCVGSDNVLKVGLAGLLAKAEARLARARDERERAFLEGVIIGDRSVIAIARRFADEAERMLASETEPVIRNRLARIAATAREVPARAPKTFYEALNTLLFMREMCASLEGLSVSILGHLDRILEPYYTNDLAEGRLTREEAKDLLRFFLAMSDVRFDMRKVRPHVGTDTTVVIGGCDARGNVVFNDLTRMIVEVYRELRLVDPKLNARISKGHPPEYFHLLADLNCERVFVFSVIRLLDELKNTTNIP